MDDRHHPSNRDPAVNRIRLAGHKSGFIAGQEITDKRPLGIVAVVSPWNFPYAIPAGGVCAALAAGNAVILKPAPEVREVAFELAQQLWRAGVPGDALQFVACPDDEVGRRLVTHDDVDVVVHLQPRCGEGPEAQRVVGDEDA